MTSKTDSQRADRSPRLGSTEPASLPFSSTPLARLRPEVSCDGIDRQIVAKVVESGAVVTEVVESSNDASIQEWVAYITAPAFGGVHRTCLGRYPSIEEADAAALSRRDSGDLT